RQCEESPATPRVRRRRRGACRGGDDPRGRRPGLRRHAEHVQGGGAAEHPSRWLGAGRAGRRRADRGQVLPQPLARDRPARRRRRRGRSRARGDARPLAERARQPDGAGPQGGEVLMDHSQVIIRPVVSEKSYVLATADKYTFRVHDKAHKTQIKQAVEALFDVNVVQLRTSKVPSKPKRRGVTAGRTRAWKKAVVQVKPGQSIPIFQGLEADL